MLFLGVFALCSLVLKIVLLCLVDAKKLRSRSYFYLLVLFAFQNLSEMVGYFLLSRESLLVNNAVDVYLIAVYFISASVLVITLSNRFILGRWVLLVYAFPFFFAIAHAAGMLVEGYVFQGFALVRVPGPWGLYIDIYLLVVSAISVILFCLSETKKPADWAILAYTIINIGTVVLQSCGFKASPAVLQPIVTILLSVFIFIEAKSATAYRFHGFLYRNWKGFLILNSTQSFTEKTDALKGLLIESAMIQTEFVQKEAAKKLGTSTSTISRRIEQN